MPVRACARQSKCWKWGLFLALAVFGWRATSYLMKTRPSDAIEMDALMLLLPMLQVECRGEAAGDCAVEAEAHGVSSSAAAIRAVIENITRLEGERDGGEKWVILRTGIEGRRAISCAACCKLCCCSGGLLRCCSGRQLRRHGLQLVFLSAVVNSISVQNI